MSYGPFEDPNKIQKQKEVPNYELIEKNLKLAVDKILTNYPHLFVQKGSGADFTEINKTQAFNYNQIKSDRIVK